MNYPSTGLQASLAQYNGINVLTCGFPKKINGNTRITAGYPKCIQYWSSAAGGHVFYTANGEKVRISDGAITTINNSLCIGQNDSYPDLSQF